MKALQNNVSRRGLSLAPCGRGQGEGQLALRAVAGSSRQILYAFVVFLAAVFVVFNAEIL
jgi:hypothetical protein